MLHISAESIQQGQFLLLNKPLRWTSHDVIARLRGPLKSFTGNKKLKVGHAGTLDPLATGLLIVLTGKATKQADAMQGLHKEYTGTITLGGITASYDLETPVVDHQYTGHITDDMLQQAARHFTAPIMQLPPAHSSVKIQGKPAYTYAREGEDLRMRPRPIEIYSFEITAVRMPEVDFSVACSKGTYIRSLAHDFGQYLRCGAYLSALCRTRIGTYDLCDAIELDAMLDMIRHKRNTSAAEHVNETTDH